jgi:hypothetical protein
LEVDPHELGPVVLFRVTAFGESESRSIDHSEGTQVTPGFRDLVIVQTLRFPLELVLKTPYWCLGDFSQFSVEESVDQSRLPHIGFPDEDDLGGFDKGGL